ncbi:MAG: YbhB/YbcL family Raf kinase inhibitor-like protein, partial [Planctomycetaceae bacterium]
DGDGTPPPLEWEAGPDGTVEYALAIWHEAPDRLKTYWVVHGIPADVRSIPAGGGRVGTVGLNDRGRPEYDPPCSRGPGVKTYHVTVWALAKPARLPPRGASREALLEAIRGITLAEGTLSFDYERQGEE